MNLKFSAISFIALVFLFSLPIVVGAVLPSDLQSQIESTKRERDSLLAEQNRLQVELDAINKESQTLGSAVKSLDATRKKLTNDISITNTKITSANLNIKALENDMSDKEKQILKHEEAIGTAIKALSNYDSRSLISTMLVYDQLSEVWRDRGELSDLNGRLAEEIGSLRDAKVALKAEKDKKEKTKAELVNLQSELGGQKKVVEENKSAKERLLLETKNKEAEYQKMLAENMARQKQAEADMYELEQQLRITLDPSLFPEPKKGILSWPLDKIFVTGAFGKSDCRIYPGPDCFHNGIDLRASVGTPVRAMLSGTILGTANTDDQKSCYSFGRWILIKHDNGLSSVYAHLSGSIVKTGQRVETGQIIGYSGGAFRAYGSGNSRAPHLHIGVYASQGVAIRQYVTSIGCKQAFVPIASGRDSYFNPLAYLPKL